MASSPEWKLELKDLPLLRRLGKGLSGYLNETVWRCKKYARKDFPLGSAERGSLFETEVQRLFNLDHPNIVKCFGYTIGKSSCSLLQEYVGYNLQNYIQRIIEEMRRKASTGASKPRVVDVDEIKGMLSANRVKRKQSSGTYEGSSTVPEARSKVTESSSVNLGRQRSVPFMALDDEDIVTQIVESAEPVDARLESKVMAKVLAEAAEASAEAFPEGELEWTRRESSRTNETSSIFQKASSKMPESSSRMLARPSAVPCEVLDAEDIVTQIAKAMKYLHDNEVIHGDLKPKNVLWDLDESGARKVKVADFGLIGTKKMIKLVSKRTRHFEILTWKAPELLEESLGPLTEDSDDPFTDSDSDLDEELGSSDTFLGSKLAMADVYSFGLTCSYVLGAKIMYPNMSLTQLRQQRAQGFEPKLPSTCPEYLKFIIHSCLRMEPLSRPTFSAICTARAFLPNLPYLIKMLEGKGLEDFMALTTLKVNFEYNIGQLPSEIGNLIALETLELDCCYKLENLPSGIGNLMALKTLVMKSCTDLHTLPSGIGNLMALKTLVMKSCTSLHTLPNEIGNLIALETLELHHCYKLEELPSGIGNLMGLKTLVMRYCKSLHTLPNEIGNLIALETLELDHCYNLGELPSGIGNLMALKRLHIGDFSRLDTLPNEIGNLTTLETLKLYSCPQLQKLPRGIGKLMALKNMVIRNCSSLHTLPDEIKNLTALKTLMVMDCPRLTHSSTLEGLDVWHSSALRRLTPSDQDSKQKRQWHLDDSNESGFLETWTREAALDTLTNWGTATSTEKGEMDYLPIENRGGQSSQVESLQDELPMMQAQRLLDLEAQGLLDLQPKRLLDLEYQRLLDPQAHLQQAHHQLPDELMRHLGDQSQMPPTGLSIGLPMPPYSLPVKPEERSYDRHSMQQKQQHFQQTHHQQQHQHHQEGIAAQGFGQLPDELMRQLADQSQMSPTGLSSGLPLPPYSRPVKPEERSYDLHSMPQKQQHYQHQAYYDLGMPSSSLQDVQSEHGLLESLHKSRSGGGIGDQPDEGEI